MHQVKDTVRALVRIGYDGRVHKTFRGHLAKERFENEVRVLRYLEERGCDFVPRLLESDPENLKIVTTNCGSLVEQLNDDRMKEIFAELLKYGVRHDDAFMRNITYRRSDGRFCVIDFEFATLLDTPPAPAVGECS
jgi:tRNA A-37 threonylcarbamoyl transferase component Bud32